MKNKKSIMLYVVLIIALGIILFLFSHEKKEDEPMTVTDFRLNTVIKLSIFDTKDQDILDGALGVCERYEKVFSRTDPDSELYRLNEGTLPKEDDYYVLSDELAKVIETGLYFSRFTDGAFDITVEPVSSLWDFTSEDKAVPEREKLKEASEKVGYEDIELKGNKLRFKKDGMGIELGAIAKGYIADKIKEYLKGRGVHSAIIDLGGNVLCVGGKEGGKPFRVGIQKPFADRNETVGTMEVRDCSIVSSGIYERCFEKDGEFYHHILNPKDGYPYKNDLVSVTIISPTSMEGDALSTVCYSLGLETGLNLANNYPNVHAVFVTKDGELHFTKNFEKDIPIAYVK